MKRLVDFAIALFAMPAVIPLCLVLMLVIRLESAGNPLFIQRRVGRHQRVFHMLKLRTMAANTGDLPSHIAGERTVTRIGRVLRRLKLDELPQLVNVLTGAMSLVGPRPCLPSQAELIDERAKRELFAYAPGITGPAQIAGIDMSDPRRLAEAEAAYFGRATLMQDLRMIIQTATGAGAGDAAISAEPRR